MSHEDRPEDDVLDPVRFNPRSMFSRGQPVWANACVGDNGLNELPQYAAGYAQAADLIIAAVLASHRGQVDVLVYPACFCIRHAVELHLKNTIGQLLSLPVANRFERVVVQEFWRSHDLGAMWELLTVKMATLDSRLTPELQKIDGLVRECAEIDRNGQVFRYPHSKKNDRHLVAQRLINFVSLHRGWVLLKEGLDIIFRLVETLKDEYSRCTFTAKLSRHQLCLISSLLPPRGEWGSPKFQETKLNTMMSFQLSGREFSKALKIIEAHREFAPRIGIEIPLIGFDEDVWRWLVKAWLYQYPERAKDYQEGSGADSHSDKVDEDDEIDESNLFSRRREIWVGAREKVSAEFLAALNALFYYAFHPDYSEDFDLAFQQQLPLKQRDERLGEDEMSRSFFHVFGKTNLIHNLARSLCALGKINWVLSLHREIELSACESAIAWYDEREARRKTG